MDEIRHLVARWSGFEDEALELTSFYGIREYHEGAYLRNHIDRSSTHVLSVILQVEQLGMNATWPVEVITFNGKRRRIDMKAGQMLFYESAKLTHGRPEALKGALFVNAFCHFKP